jgi:chorismate mutase/prephenate dehydratase
MNRDLLVPKTMSSSQRVSYMGPAGTFSHVAARAAFPDATHVEAPTIASVIDEVAAKNAEFGVVPIENSTEGSVTPTLDALLEGALQIRGELVIEVALCLLARHGDRSRFRRVASHPQPLAQCRHWLARELPEAEPWPTASTVVAAREALADDSVAAVASRLAAELHGLTIVAENIQDRPENATRFVVVADTDAELPTGNDKTSVVFTTRHERGALRRALEAFDDGGINLTRIESRPALGRRWEYVFFTELEGHRRDPNVEKALERLAFVCGSVRVLGSYPRAVADSH